MDRVSGALRRRAHARAEGSRPGYVSSYGQPGIGLDSRQGLARQHSPKARYGTAVEGASHVRFRRGKEDRAREMVWKRTHTAPRCGDKPRQTSAQHTTPSTRTCIPTPLSGAAAATVGTQRQARRASRSAPVGHPPANGRTGYCSQDKTEQEPNTQTTSIQTHLQRSHPNAAPPALRRDGHFSPPAPLPHPHTPPYADRSRGGGGCMCAVRASSSSTRLSNWLQTASNGAVVSRSTPACRRSTTGSTEPPPRRTAR